MDRLIDRLEDNRNGKTEQRTDPRGRRRREVRHMILLELVQRNRLHQRDMNLIGYSAHLNAATSTRFEPQLLDGVMVLEHPGSISRPQSDPGLYFMAGDTPKVDVTPTTIRLIPYYAWANRDPASMQVWIPYSNA